MLCLLENCETLPASEEMSERGPLVPVCEPSDVRRKLPSGVPLLFFLLPAFNRSVKERPIITLFSRVGVWSMSFALRCPRKV